MIEKNVSEREAGYPDIQLYARWYPSYGLFIRHIKNITIRDVEFYYKRKDQRPSVFCDDVSDIIFNNVSAQSNNETQYIFYLKNAHDVLFRNCIRNKEAKKYLRVEGESSNIELYDIIGLREEDVAGEKNIINIK